MRLDVSFVWGPDKGSQAEWFVFDEGGRTVRRGFPSKASALAWIAMGAKTSQKKERHDGERQ